MLVGDFLFVNKLVYGPHLPIIDVNLPGYADPKRSEIAVYRSPDARDGNPTVVKRILGLPDGHAAHARRPAARERHSGKSDVRESVAGAAWR